MGEPPRLADILLPQEQSIIYFVTMCVDNRPLVLANPQIFGAIRETLAQLRHWRVLAGVVMPDHVHFVVTPVAERRLSVGDFSTGFKRVLRKGLPDQRWEWQRGCFDRLLRSDEDLHEKWRYIEHNPIRAGFVNRVEDWPYYLGTNAEQQHNPGKLTASPTDQWS
jgi:putative transposase